MVRRSSSHRRDIQGLRALAILAVVAYHAGVPGISGGFVGVDFFFVLSGFLITGLLLREHDATARYRCAPSGRAGPADCCPRRRWF